MEASRRLSGMCLHLCGALIAMLETEEVRHAVMRPVANSTLSRT